MKKGISGKNLLLFLGGCLAATLSGCYVYSDQPPLPPVLVVPAQTPVPAQQTVPVPPPAPVGPPTGEVGPIR
jgi:hypothetical protein